MKNLKKNLRKICKIFLTLYCLVTIYRHDDETNSKHGDVDDNDEEVRSTKDGEDRPSSSGKT